MPYKNNSGGLSFKTKKEAQRFLDRSGLRCKTIRRKKRRYQIVSSASCSR